MKNIIKKILRENTSKNILGVAVTRPNQELIVMRGIPGSGKSTKAKSLIGKGSIHSTDDVIEMSGDYNEFFAKMIANKDFSPLSKAHAQNLKNAIESMKSGVTPVIIDNTNIKPNEAKAYVKAALEMGYADDNINFVDIGTAGLDAEVLAKRNAHGVPLDKIKQMIDSHTSHGPLTLQKVLDSKDMYNTQKPLYASVVLDDESHEDLLNHNYPVDIPEDWKLIAHHMTIVFGKGVDEAEVGKYVSLKVTHVGLSDMAMAVRVSGYPSNNAIPHITLAINPNGGKAVMSNDIKEWYDIKPFYVTGKVENNFK